MYESLSRLSVVAGMRQEEKEDGTLNGLGGRTDSARDEASRRETELHLLPACPAAFFPANPGAAAAVPAERALVVMVLLPPTSPSQSTRHTRRSAPFPFPSFPASLSLSLCCVSPSQRANQVGPTPTPALSPKPRLPAPAIGRPKDANSATCRLLGTSARTRLGIRHSCLPFPFPPPPALRANQTAGWGGECHAVTAPHGHGAPTLKVPGIGHVSPRVGSALYCLDFDFREGWGRRI